MFFVAIGIIILFASFIIALISLIREQNEAEQDRDEVAVTPPDVPEGDNGLPVEASKVEESEEPFPWEAASANEKEGIEEVGTAPEEAMIPKEQKGENLSGEISLRNLKRQ